MQETEAQQSRLGSFSTMAVDIASRQGPTQICRNDATTAFNDC
jgi:hypothetical protein